MSLNVGGLYVRAKDRDAVVDAIERFWIARGARRNDQGALKLEPLSLEKTGQLGFVISEPVDGWIAVYDSERYRADGELGKFLAKELACGVAHYEMAGASDIATYAAYGDAPKPKGKSWDAIETFVAETFPYAFLYYNQLDDASDFAVLGFDNIGPGKGEYAGPSTKERGKEAQLAEAKRLGKAGDVAGLRALMKKAPHVKSAIRDIVKYASDPDFVLAFAEECVDDPWTHREVGVAAVKKRDWKLFERAFVDEENYVLWESSAWSLYQAGDVEGATRIYAAIVERPAASPGAWKNWLGMMTEKKSPKVVKQLEAAVAIGPKDPGIFHNLASQWERFGDRERALGFVEQAVQYGYEVEKLKQDEALKAVCADKRFATAIKTKRAFDLAQLDTKMTIYKKERMVMRPVLGFFFYFTTPIHKLGPLVAAAVEKYMEQIAPVKLGFYKHGHWKKLDKAGLTRNLNKLRKIPAQHVFAEVAMRDGDGDATDFSFEASLRAESDEASEFKLTYPRTIDPELAYERFVEFAKLLPAQSGSAGYTLGQRDDCSVYEGVSWDDESVYARCLGFERHPMREWNRGTAGAHWLTLLDKKLVEKVGGAKSLEKAIGKAKLDMIGDTAIIRAAKRPPIGLATRPADLGALPTVAIAIKKLRSKGKVATEESYNRFDALEPTAYNN